MGRSYGMGGYCMGGGMQGAQRGGRAHGRLGESDARRLAIECRVAAN